MNNLDKSYLELLQDILDNGIRKDDRTGTGTISVFGRQIRHNMSEGFPLLTTKKMYWKGIVTELLWFLRGDTNIKYLVDNDCNIWTGDAYKKYYSTWEMDTYGVLDALSQEEFINRIKTNPEFAKQWGELGPVYGKQWRSWGRKNATIYDCKDVKGSDQYKAVEAIKNGEDVAKYGVKIEYQNNSIDQIANLIRDLKTNPDSRRLMVSAWNVGELDQMTLPPCHYGFQVYTRELSRKERSDYYYKNGNKEGIVEGSLDRPIWEDNETAHKWYSDRNVPARTISLMFNMRSNDVPLGLPFNLASYGLLLQIIAKEVNMVPDELIASLGDAHIYVNQIDGVKEQLTREPYKLPTLMCKDEYWYLKDVDITFSEKIEKFKPDFFKIEDYQSHPSIKIPLSN